MPPWWSWDLELTPHVEDRMEERGLTELELRRMLVRPADLQPDHFPGRWLAECRVRGETWHVVVEPDVDDEVIVVVTAYRID